MAEFVSFDGGGKITQKTETTGTGTAATTVVTHDVKLETSIVSNVIGMVTDMDHFAVGTHKLIGLLVVGLLTAWGGSKVTRSHIQKALTEANVDFNVAEVKPAYAIIG